MMQPRGVLGLLASAALLAAAAGGCSIIVSGDVPDFQCAPAGSTSACPSGMTCSDTGHCVSAEAGMLDPVEAGDDGDAPSTDDASDAAKEADAPTGPLDLGSKCRVDGDCKSHLCASSTVLTTAITSSTGPICTTPCCTSNECGSGFICFNGGTGGGYCVPATLAQRTPPATGGKGAGISCNAGSECRSGFCSGSPKTCIDTCCAESDCGGSSTCRIASVAAPGPAHDIWVCALPEAGSTKLPGAACVDGLDCKSDNCIGVSSGRVCRPACSNTASCKAISGFSSGHCLYGPSGSDYFKFCFVNGAVSGSQAAGTLCSDNSNCQSDYCDAELKKCLNVCARDIDCSTGEACRPSAVNTPFLRCVPKP